MLPKFAEKDMECYHWKLNDAGPCRLIGNSYEPSGFFLEKSQPLTWSNSVPSFSLTKISHHHLCPKYRIPYVSSKDTCYHIKTDICRVQGDITLMPIIQEHAEEVFSAAIAAFLNNMAACPFRLPILESSNELLRFCWTADVPLADLTDCWRWFWLVWLTLFGIWSGPLSIVTKLLFIVVYRRGASNRQGYIYGNV